MTSTATKILSKIDDFSVAVSISELSGLAKGLLQLQHARYPHLVPMYRTVHRTKPGALVLRAIRWVNPKRMFPGAGYTKEEMANMSKKDLENLIVRLNDYRGEALVIHNRYDQMLEMINMGELPYYIPYAGFTQDKWTMLQEYKDRAERLKDGTKEWELVLDRQALDIRSILKQKHDAKIDDIEGLWKDAKGNDAAPNFMDIKKGIGQKQPLRRTRNGKLIDPPKVYARRYMAVPMAEQRRGEEIRMPAGGKVRRPGRNDPVGRKVFDEHGAAAGHLVRVPKGPFLGTDRNSLRNKGQLMSMPVGRGHPMIITFSEVADHDVANRRLGRWTHTDPLGKRGQAPHRGPASRGRHGSVPIDPNVDPIPHGAERTRPASLLDTEAKIRAAQKKQQQQQQQQPQQPQQQPQQQQQGPVAQPSTRQEEPEDVQEKARNINAHFNVAASNLFKKYGVDTSGLEALGNLNPDDVVSIGPLGGGGGVNTAASFKLEMKDGTNVAYKVVEGEQKSETLASILDKVLNLNTQVDAVIYNDIDLDMLRAKGVKGIQNTPDVVANARERGGGHLQQFCTPNCKEWADIGPGEKMALMQDNTFRESYIKMTLLDFIGGNWDRHRRNFMVSSDGVLRGIDNGFHGGYTEVGDGDGIENVGKGTWTHQGHYGDTYEIRSGLFPETEGREIDRHHPARDFRRQGGITSSQIKSEAITIFDRHYSEDKIKDIQQTLGMDNGREGQSVEDIKNAFLSHIASVV